MSGETRRPVESTAGAQSTVEDLRAALDGLPDAMPLEIAIGTCVTSPLDRVETVEVDNCGAPGGPDGVETVAFVWPRSVRIDDSPRPVTEPEARFWKATEDHANELRRIATEALRDLDAMVTENRRIQSLERTPAGEDRVTARVLSEVLMAVDRLRAQMDPALRTADHAWQWSRPPAAERDLMPRRFGAGGVG